VEERWDGRRGKHVHKDSRGSASAPGAGGGPRKSVPMGSSPASPSACLPLNASDPNLQIPASARSQYGSNLTPTGNIFPLVAQIIKSALPTTPAVGSRSPAGDLSIDSICEELSEDPTPVGRVSPTPGKAMNLSLEEREEVGWSSPSQGASDQEYMRNSEQRSKLNHDRPSRKLMLEAAAAETITSPPPALVLQQAPAICDANPAEGQLLLLDAPIPALGAPVARGPRSKASPAEAVRKSARSKGASEGPVLERAIRATADKNNLTKSAIDTATPSSSTPAPGTFPSPADFVAFQDSSLAICSRWPRIAVFCSNPRKGHRRKRWLFSRRVNARKRSSWLQGEDLKKKRLSPRGRPRKPSRNQMLCAVVQRLAPRGSHPRTPACLILRVQWGNLCRARAKPRSLLSLSVELLAGQRQWVTDLSPAKHGL
jgi:hypothetical protein